LRDPITQLLRETKKEEKRSSSRKKGVNWHIHKKKNIIEQVNDCVKSIPSSRCSILGPLPDAQVHFRPSHIPKLIVCVSYIFDYIIRTTHAYIIRIASSMYDSLMADVLELVES
jgi:hypothetical protein